MYFLRLQTGFCVPTFEKAEYGNRILQLPSNTARRLQEAVDNAQVNATEKDSHALSRNPAVKASCLSWPSC